MKSGVWIRLLGAGVIYVALMSLVASVAAFVGRPAYAYSGHVALRLWTSLGIATAIDLALLWAGASIVSRRPSRRRVVALVLVVGFAESLHALWTWPSLAEAMELEPTFVSIHFVRLVVLGIALAYVFATWRRPEFQPRLQVPPAQPGSQPHKVVAAEISNGPNWHADLLASLQQTGLQETPRRRVWPWILALFAALVVATLIADLASPLLDAVDPQWRGLAELIFGLVYIVLIGAPLAVLRRRTSQARQRSAETALQKSGAKRPIFYLRSFALDDQVGRPSILELMSNVQPANPEQAMIRVARRCGPVLAIGRPGERLPALGAARFYVSDDLWQEKVADVATVAQLVVWASGTTQGLEWEITHLVRSLAPEKLILWPHPQLLDLDANEREAQWSAFIDGLGTLFPKPLPKPLGDTQFFAFDKDFTPIPFTARRLTPKGRLMASLRALLRAKDIAPYDKVRTARLRRIRRIIFGTIGTLVALAVLGFGIIFWNHIRPQAPAPIVWNYLGSDLFADEAYVTPFSADHIIANLQDTIGQLDGKWFGSNWEDTPPGELPPLKLVAQHYLRPYQLAHADPLVEPVFYANGSYLEFHVHSAAEAQALLQKLLPLDDALKSASADWQNVKPETTGFFYADKVRALIAARKQILDAETAFLTLMATHPNAWALTHAADGTTSLSFTADTLARAQALVAQRQAGANALTAALTP